MNNNLNAVDVFGCKNCEIAMISEEVKALKQGEEAYCFNKTQLEQIQKLCKVKKIKFTYEIDSDGFYTLTPCECKKDKT